MAIPLKQCEFECYFATNAADRAYIVLNLEPSLKSVIAFSTNSTELLKAVSEMNPVHLPITSPAASGIVRILYLRGWAYLNRMK